MIIHQRRVSSRLACAFLELNRREPGLGHPLESACEVPKMLRSLGKSGCTFW